MKSSVKIVLSAVVLTSLLAIGSQAYAQTMSAQVPFNYIANGTRHAAGTYRISVDSDSIVRLSNGNDSVVLLAQPGISLDPGSASKLTFNCYGNSCFLSKIWIAGGRMAQFGKTKAERELQLEAKQNAEREVVMAAK